MIKNEEVSYWTDYYRSGAVPEEPSLFAQYVLQNYVQEGDRLIELGCGNGRDARFFAANGVGVIAVDQCSAEIEELAKSNGTHENLHFKVADFTDMPDSEDPYDAVYSRFTLHSVTAEGQKNAIAWSYRNLAPGGRLCIETRGQKNELFQKGKPVDGEADAFIYNDHYRRFVEFDDFTKQIVDSGFELVEAVEDIGFAPFEDTNYHFIRAIAKKI